MDDDDLRTPVGGASPAPHDAPEPTPATPVTSVLEQGVEELRRVHGPTLGDDVVERIVFESFEDLAASGTDMTHREALAVRFAEARLDALAELEGAAPRGTGTPRVLFVCVQNAGRSQLAAALLADRAGDAVAVASAGSRPSSHIHGTVAPVLEEMGADPEDVFPKPVSPELLHAADYVVTMGCGDAVEVGESTDLRDWPVGDPAEVDELELQRIVRDIETRVADLWAEISQAA